MSYMLVELTSRTEPNKYYIYRNGQTSMYGPSDRPPVNLPVTNVFHVSRRQFDNIISKASRIRTVQDVKNIIDKDKHAAIISGIFTKPIGKQPSQLARELDESYSSMEEGLPYVTPLPQHLRHEHRTRDTIYKFLGGKRKRTRRRRRLY